MKRKIVFLCISIIVLFVIIALKPISFSNKNISGKITKIYEGGIKDVVFEIENNESTFYINRGLENKFNLEKIKKKQLLGKEVSIGYSVGWTPLYWFNKRSKDILVLKYGENIIYKNLIF